MNDKLFDSEHRDSPTRFPLHKGNPDVDSAVRITPVADNSPSAPLSSAPDSQTIEIVGGNLANPVSERILVRLAQAEAREVDAWLRDDYRIAWLCVLHSAEGIPNPWGYAFWRYLGRTYEKLLPEFLERQRKHAAMEIPDYDPTVKRLPSPALPPKKEIA